MFLIVPLLSLLEGIAMVGVAGFFLISGRVPPPPAYLMGTLFLLIGVTFLQESFNDFKHGFRQIQRYELEKRRRIEHQAFWSRIRLRKQEKQEQEEKVPTHV